jgi:hypothetical protein
MVESKGTTVAPKKVDAPPLPERVDDVKESTTDTEPSLADRVAKLEADVKRLSKKGRNQGKQDEELRNRVEDILDYLYGTNVRPPLTVREAGDYPAEVRPSNEDDKPDTDEK